MRTLISFPGLGIPLCEINPVAVRLFGVIELHWSGLLTLLSLLLAFWYTVHVCRREGILPTDVIDVGMAALACGIVTSRAYYVLTTLGTVPYATVWDVADLSGGASVVGAMLGGVAASVVACRIKHISIARFLDAAAPAGLMALAIARWGDLINGSAYGALIGTETAYELLGLRFVTPSGQGTVTHLLRMGLERYGYFAYYHPTFLYESILCAVGFVLFLVADRRKRFYGQTALACGAWYGFLRGIVEGWRADALYIAGTNLRVTQCVALALGVGALSALIVLRKKDNKKTER